MLERNYEVVEVKGMFRIRYECYHPISEEWVKTFFEDWNGDYLEFYNEDLALNWISAREEVLKIGL